MSASPDQTLTLADLAHWDFPGTALAVLGHPIAHSLSPVMHNAALAHMARTDPRFASWRYFKFDIAPADLPAALAIFQQKKFLGLNLTVPHKSLVLEHLATSEPFVRAAGAANTLSLIPKGWHGDNTDGYGLDYALRELGTALPDNSILPGCDMVLLGAGGAARAAAYQCLHSKCRSLWIGNRTSTTAEKLIADLAAYVGNTTCRPFDPTQPPEGIPSGATVVNATSLGLKPSDAAPIDLTRLESPALVYDMIYRPAQTALLRQAATTGIRHANGLSMLLHQGAQSLRIWSGVTPPIDVMRAALHAAL